VEIGTHVHWIRSFACSHVQRHEELSKFLYKKKVVSVAVLLGFLVVPFPVLPVMCCPAVNCLQCCPCCDNVVLMLICIWSR